MISFNNSNFFYDPFPHCLLNDFLDKSFYEEICKEYPDEEFFEKKIEKKKNDKKFEKFNFSNVDKNKDLFYNFLNSTKATKEFYNYINSEIFRNELNSFLKKNYIDLRINVNRGSYLRELLNKILKKNVKFDFEFSSIPLKNGYILPHTDGGNKLLGFVIPIIDDIEILKAKNIGTKILKANSNEFKFNYYNKTVPFDKTELVRELPFEKNQMTIHVKTFNSLHAVGPIDTNDIKKDLVRKSISMFLVK